MSMSMSSEDNRIYHLRCENEKLKLHINHLMNNEKEKTMKMVSLEDKINTLIHTMEIIDTTTTTAINNNSSSSSTQAYLTTDGMSSSSSNDHYIVLF